MHDDIRNNESLAFFVEIGAVWRQAQAFRWFAIPIVFNVYIEFRELILKKLVVVLYPQVHGSVGQIAIVAAQFSIDGSLLVVCRARAQWLPTASTAMAGLATVF